MPTIPNMIPNRSSSFNVVFSGFIGSVGDSQMLAHSYLVVSFCFTYVSSVAATALKLVNHKGSYMCGNGILEFKHVTDLSTASKHNL